MSDRALKKATELVAQFLNRMPGPERSAPDEQEIRMATDHLLRGAPYAAVEVLQQPIRIASLNRWKESEGVFWEWMVATGNHCAAFSVSTTVSRRMTDEELNSVVGFLRENAEAILFPIENEEEVGEEGPALRVRRVHKPPVKPLDQGTGKYGRQQRAAYDPYEPLHEEEGGPGFRM